VKLEEPSTNIAPAVSAKGELRRIQKVVLTDDVSRMLFSEFAEHRESDRRDEEIGWALLGLREVDHSIVLATLPAGVHRDAGESHVRFHSEAQLLASRMCRQYDRRLQMLGVVHTHPGKLRHPSQGDFAGDRQWVRQLRGAQGIFGIGTVDSAAREMSPGVRFGNQPRPSVQSLGELRFDWYTLAAEDRKYQPLPVEMRLGPDVATELRAVWGPIEQFADRLERLARQLTHVRFDVAQGQDGPALCVQVKLARDAEESIRVMMEEKSVRFFYDTGTEVLQPDLSLQTAPDHGIYLLLAELAARA
jgi:proteasome lid subunit RPN8/RPN11